MKFKFTGSNKRKFSQIKIIVIGAPLFAMVVIILGILLTGIAYAAPDYIWTKTMGGIGYDLGLSVAADNSGSIFITGPFEDTIDFDPDPISSDNHTTAGSHDIFLTKFNSDGTYGWTLSIGGADSDWVSSVALDSSGNVFLTGSFNGTVDFNPDPVGTDFHAGSMFITKINADSSYGWTQSIEGGVDVSSVVVDNNNNIFLIGDFGGTVDFNPDPVGTDIHTGSVFITKINKDGTYQWTQSFADEYFEVWKGALDNSGNIYVTGSFSGSTDFNPDPLIADIHTSNGEDDIFLTKINSDGSYGWTKSMGGPEWDKGSAVVLDSNGNIFLTGGFKGTVDFNPDPISSDNLTSAGSDDIFLTKFNSDGFYAWTIALGGAHYDRGDEVIIDNQGNIYLCGLYGTNGTSWNPDYMDIFIAKINTDGTYDWSETVGGTGEDIVYGATINSSGNIFMTGAFSETVDFNFDPVESDSHISTGDTDIFLMKLQADTSADPGDGGDSGDGGDAGSSSGSGGGGGGCFIKLLVQNASTSIFR